MSFIIYLATGFLAGIVGGLLGTGGCALMMPVIRFGFHFDPAVAVGTTLTAVVFTAGSGAFQHMKAKNVDAETAVLTGYSGVLGVIIGSFVFSFIQNYGRLIDLIIGLAFIIISMRMFYEGVFLGSLTASPDAKISGSPLKKSLTGSFIGVLTGIIGLGGGYALVPSYLYFFQAPMKIAIGTSMAAFFWIALIGAIFKIFQHSVNLSAALNLGLGAAAGAIYGAKMVSKIKSKNLKILFSLLFFYVSLKYILIFFGISI